MNPLGKFVFHPFLQIGEAGKRLGHSVANLKSGIRRRSVDSGVVTSDESPKEEFQRIYDRNGWDEDALSQRLWGLNVARRAANLAAFVLLILLGLWLVFKSPAWWQISIFGVSVVAAIMGLVFRAIGNAFMVFQIENREFCSVDKFLSSSDLIRRVFF